MKRAICLGGVVSFLMAFLGTTLAFVVALPVVVGAQETRIRAERVTVVGDNSAERVDLATGPGLNVAVQVNDSNGARRAGFNTGACSRATTQTDPASTSGLPTAPPRWCVWGRDAAPPERGHCATSSISLTGKEISVSG